VARRERMGGAQRKRHHHAGEHKPPANVTLAQQAGEVIAGRKTGNGGRRFITMVLTIVER
jgi:hypothetical protein